MALPVLEPDLYDSLNAALQEYCLLPVWNYVQKSHATTLQYHNLDHIWITMAAAESLATSEGGNVRRAIVAAMFHDVGHSGAPPDSHNVETALDYLHHAARLNWSGQLDFPLSMPDLNAIEQAIACTTYDGGKFPTEPDCLQDQIMRDSDLWNPFLEPENAKFMIAGLGKELGLWNETTLNIGIRGTMDFFKKVTWYTKTMQARALDVQDLLLDLLLPED